MTSKEIIEIYLDFYKSRGHAQIPNLPLVPDNDPTLLFVNSGMFPLVPYLSGQPHALGKRLVNIQRCLRFEDIDNVGTTPRHTTAFHMLGNWSLGDYFKAQQLPWIFEFYIEKLKLDPERLYATVFRGNSYATKDETSIDIIKQIYKKYNIEAKEGERIFTLGEDDNWWKRGDAPGELGGPCSEVYYYFGNQGKNGKGLGLNLQDPQHEMEFIEIGNSVFMEFKKREDGGWDPLAQRNVDYGGGLERLAMVCQRTSDIYETDNFKPIIEALEQLTGKSYRENTKITRTMRVIADHIRSAVFMGMDGVTPSNKEQGYVLRQILRRMTRACRPYFTDATVSAHLVPVVVKMFSWLYPDLITKQKDLEAMFVTEEERFINLLKQARPRVQRLIEQTAEIDLPKVAFDLYQSFGYPVEIFLTDLSENTVKFDKNKFLFEYRKIFNQHQYLSRQGARQKFRGGLADASEQTTRYHTATHILHQVLCDVIGESVSQQGSNITAERLRFDFSADRKLTPEELQKVEEIINEKIAMDLPVKIIPMTKDEAIATGAKAFFKKAYPDKVNVCYIGDNLEYAYSKELCGGPHVQSTKAIGNIKIFKYEKIGEKVYRIYAKSN